MILLLPLAALLKSSTGTGITCTYNGKQTGVNCYR